MFPWPWWKRREVKERRNIIDEGVFMKDKFTQKWKLSHLLAYMPMESQLKFPIPQKGYFWSSIAVFSSTAEVDGDMI